MVRPRVARGFVNLADAVLHQCIRPLIGACCAPGHHGYLRAFELISGQASNVSLGVLGLNGITAYFGLLDHGLPRPGDTVVVSTAAGAVGSAVGQIAKLTGCRTVGIAGGPTKTKLCLDEFGYDVAIDYKAAGSIDERLAAACPDGVDVHFDSTSGPISDAVMARLSVGARVAICGTASVASWDPPPLGPRVERHILVKRARVSGFIIFDYQHRYMEAVKRLAEWVREGKLRYREEIPTALNIARQPSPSFIGGKISARD
jgi:NADPH-dependent curcumin reductase CurA